MFFTELWINVGAGKDGYAVRFSTQRALKLSRNGFIMFVLDDLICVFHRNFSGALRSCKTTVDKFAILEFAVFFAVFGRSNTVENSAANFSIAGRKTAALFNLFLFLDSLVQRNGHQHLFSSIRYNIN